MAAFPDDSRPRRQVANRYFISPENIRKDIARLVVQDQMLQYKFGGLLPSFFEPYIPTWTRVLDLACGTGGWLCAMAEQYPHLQLDGLDIMQDYVGYAREDIARRGLTERVTITQGDAMMDPYDDKSFDFVHLQLASSFLHKQEWPGLLDKIYSLLKPKGFVLIVDGETGSQESTSQAQLTLSALFTDAFEHSMQTLSPGPRGTINALPAYLKRYLFENVHADYRNIDFHAGTEEAELMWQDTEYALTNAKKFLQKWTGVSDEVYEPLRKRVLTEMSHPDWACTWMYGFIWGQKPDRGNV